MQYIVAIDGSEESDAAVRYAAKQAAAFEATLEIAHVLEPETDLVDGEIVMPGGKRAMEIGDQTLEQATELAIEAADELDWDAEIETKLLTGRPAESLTSYAEKTDTEAMYIGHRGLSEEQEQVVGSVAKSVVDKATVPVTVIR